MTTFALVLGLLIYAGMCAHSRYASVLAVGALLVAILVTVFSR